MSTTAPQRGRGRPRDQRADARILAACREVVAEVGVRNASMSAIAERAGCGKPTIYLRWRNARAVVVAALGQLDVDETAARLAHDGSLFLRTLADMPGGAFLAECAAASDGRDELASLLWGEGV